MYFLLWDDHSVTCHSEDYVSLKRELHVKVQCFILLKESYVPNLKHTFRSCLNLSFSDCTIFLEGNLCTVRHKIRPRHVVILFMVIWTGGLYYLPATVTCLNHAYMAGFHHVKNGSERNMEVVEIWYSLHIHSGRDSIQNRLRNDDLQIPPKTPTFKGLIVGMKSRGSL